MGNTLLKVILIPYFLFVISLLSAQTLTLVELNCENLFDCRHDTLKQDTEWLPASTRHWTPSRYWRKMNNIGQTILSCQEEGVPDLVALVEVENDSVLFALTRKSLLRNAGYQYLMTESPDERGIDVALLYQPFTFRPLCYDYLDVKPLEGMRPTRDILYVMGETLHGDTLHVFVSPALLDCVEQAYINDAPFLLEEDQKYGGVKPFRTYNGMRYQRGHSDHLPLVVRFQF